jgi:hypothetical protein
MDELEKINKLEKLNYYDPEDWEEDKPLETIPKDVQELFEEKENLFEIICGNINSEEASKISCEERNQKRIQSNNFIYGEIVINKIY